MKTIFKLVFFSVVLNLATGLIQVGINDNNGNNVFQQQDFARINNYNPNGTATFISTQQSVTNPGASSTDSGNLVFRLLDLISLGLINKVITVIDSYLYGFVNFLNAFVGRWMYSSNPLLYTLLFGSNIYVTSSTYIPVAGILKGLITVGYIVAAFELWTNKSLTD